MRALEILAAEHEEIVESLEALLTISEKLALHEPVAPHAIERLVLILRALGDDCHDAKEEGALFPALEAAGLSRASGPLAALHEEHEQGRKLLRELADALPALESSENARRSFVASARRYVELMEEHLQKEEHVLWPAAERLLGPDDDARIVAALERGERDGLGVFAHRRIHDEIGRLNDTYSR